MSRFRYKAVGAEGEVVTGWMEAGSVDEVVARLQDQGATPLQAEPAADAGTGARALRALLRRGPLDGDARAEFTFQLATLLGAGQPLDRALGLLADLPGDARARHLLARVRDRVRGGSPLSTALEEESGAFPPLYVALVRAGELGGTLDEALRRLAEYLERAEALRGTVINALIYPAFLLVGVLGSLVLLLAYVVPQFVPIFADMQVPVPWITRAVLALGEFLASFGWLLALALAAAVYAWRVRLREPAARLAWDARLLRLRTLGPLIRNVETARIAHTLGTLAANGVPLLAAIGMTRKVTANRALGAALEAAQEDVKDGSGLGLALGRTGAFPRLAVHMVQVGEEAGELDAMLLKVAASCERDSQRTMARLVAALVPALTIVMAVLVALVMAAILLPLLSLTSAIQ